LRAVKPSNSTLVRLFVTALAYFVVLVVVAVLAFFCVLVLAGPHGGVLPNFTQPAVLVTGWVIVIVAPVLVARLVWRGTAKRLGSRST
jgi:hypothetical protein